MVDDNDRRLRTGWRRSRRDRALENCQTAENLLWVDNRQDGRRVPKFMIKKKTTFEFPNLGRKSLACR